MARSHTRAVLSRSDSDSATLTGLEPLPVDLLEYACMDDVHGSLLLPNLSGRHSVETPQAAQHAPALDALPVGLRHDPALSVHVFPSRRHPACDSLQQRLLDSRSQIYPAAAY